MKTAEKNYQQEERRVWIGMSVAIISCALVGAYFVGLMISM